MPRMAIMIDIFQKIKNEIDFRTGITRLYPHLQINKRGQRWAARCVFHNEEEPSLTFYRNGYYCFGCGVKGDLISFVARYENITPIDAAGRIATEFGIAINRPLTRTERKKHRELNQEQQLQEAFRAWKKQIFIEVCCWRDAVQNIFDEKKLNVDSAELELIHWLPFVEYIIEILAIGSETEKLEMFRNYLSGRGRQNEPA